MYVCVYQSLYEKDQNKSLIPLLFNSSTWFPSSYHNKQKKNQEFKENFTLLSSPSSLPLYLCSEVGCENKDLLWSGLYKQLKLMPLTIFAIWAHSPALSPIWSTAAVHVQCHSLHLLMWEKSQLTNYQLLSTSSSSSSYSFSPGKVPGTTTPLPHKLCSCQE
jgi:hypothetical protein